MAESVYSHLTRLPRAQFNVREIGQATRLPRDQVIAALEELQDRGLALPVEWAASRRLEAVK